MSPPPRRPTHGDGRTSTRNLEPVCCDTCGEQLEVICPRCDRPAAGSLDTPTRRGPRPPAGTIDARRYRAKPCAKVGCGAEFVPTGPRALYCPKCKGKEAAA